MRRELDEQGRSLQVYLLGTVDFEVALLFQKRLLYEVSGNQKQAALILCEHPPLITVGRQGSHQHIRFDPQELRRRQWRVRWVNRGGGCMLHLPGQLAVYPILPLEQLGLSVKQYLHTLSKAFVDLTEEFPTIAHVQPGPGGIWVGNRLLASFGVAVRHWVSYFGAYLNMQPCLDAFRLVHCDRRHGEPMTSLARERRGPIRPSDVRTKFVEHFQARFGFKNMSLFTNHPCLEGYQQRCQEVAPWVPVSSSREAS